MATQQNEIPNLDKICAEYGFKILENVEEIENNKGKSDKAKDFEREITKALGILMEDGLFAYAIWLESKKEKKRRKLQT